VKLTTILHLVSTHIHGVLYGQQERLYLYLSAMIYENLHTGLSLERFFMQI
jgi:hypothetical protein